MKEKTLNRLQALFAQFRRVRGLFGVLGLIVLFCGAVFAVCVPTVGFAKFDFDADCKADFPVYRDVTNQWWMKFSGGGIPTWCPAVPGCTIGMSGPSGNHPVPADYDGNGKTDAAYYRPTDGAWLIIPSTNPFSVTVRIWWSGAAGNNEIPQPADYNNDHKDDLAYYLPATGQWKVTQLSGGAITVPTLGGQAGDKPVVGDYDGDGNADPAIVRTVSGVYRWMIIKSSGGPMLDIQWGLPTDIPVRADYDGDGKTDIAVYREPVMMAKSGQWWIFNSSNGTAQVIYWGGVGDIPIPADYDGDGREEPAVYRPLSSSQWWASSTQTGPIASFGSATDEPAPHVYVP